MASERPADIVKLYAEFSMEDRRQITRRMAELLTKESGGSTNNVTRS
jgi:hypothetical protein